MAFIRHPALLNISGPIPGPLNVEHYIPFAAPNTSAVGAGGQGVFVAQGVDMSLTAASLAAQWMLTRKLLENWLVWIVADVVYVGMFTYKELQLTAVLYAIFLGLAVMGWLEWRRSMHAVTVR